MMISKNEFGRLTAIDIPYSRGGSRPDTSLIHARNAYTRPKTVGLFGPVQRSLFEVYVCKMWTLNSKKFYDTRTSRSLFVTGWVFARSYNKGNLQVKADKITCKNQEKSSLLYFVHLILIDIVYSASIKLISIFYIITCHRACLKDHCKWMTYGKKLIRAIIEQKRVYYILAQPNAQLVRPFTCHAVLPLGLVYLYASGPPESPLKHRNRFKKKYMPLESQSKVSVPPEKSGELKIHT